MGPGAVEEASDIIMGGVQCLNALLLAKYIFFKMVAKFFSLIKKYKKSNAISFESVLLDIKIDVFSVKKEHTFSGFPHIH